MTIAAPISLKRAFNAALLAAVAEGNIRHVKQALTDGASANAENESVSALMTAAVGGHADIFDLLCDNGAFQGHRDKDGRSTLHHAALGQKPDMIEKIAADKTLVDSADAMGFTPLHVSVRVVRELSALAEKNIRVLLAHGADPLAATVEKWTALHTAAEKDSGLLRLFLHDSVNLDLATSNGKSILHLVMERGDLPMAQELVARGAAVNRMDKFGKSPLDIARALGGKEAENTLRQAWHRRETAAIRDGVTLTTAPARFVVKRNF